MDTKLRAKGVLYDPEEDETVTLKGPPSETRTGKIIANKKLRMLKKRVPGMSWNPLRLLRCRAVGAIRIGGLVVTRPLGAIGLSFDAGIGATGRVATCRIARTLVG